jgi:hypothetical protein
MKLMNMSQYEGEDREQVIAGEKLLRSLGKDGRLLLWIAGQYLDSWDRVNEMDFWWLRPAMRRPFTDEDSASLHAYAKVYYHVKAIKERLECS